MEIDYRLTSPIQLDVQLRVEGLTVLLGVNGAGKTSILRAIAGLIPADGTPYGGVPVQRRPIGYLPQHYALFPHLDAMENVAFALHERPRPERERRAAALLESLGVSHCSARRPSEMSGGEKQRVALARALAREPELLLLDEPLSAVDGSARREIVDWLTGTISRLAIPALVVTHDPMLARAASRVAILSRGRVVQQGPRDDVFLAPGSVDAARLLDFGTILYGHHREGDRDLVRTPIGDLTLTGPGSRGNARASGFHCAIATSAAWIISEDADAPHAGAIALRTSATLLRAAGDSIATVQVRGHELRGLLSPELIARRAGPGEAVTLVVMSQGVRLLE